MMAPTSPYIITYQPGKLLTAELCQGLPLPICLC